MKTKQKNRNEKIILLMEEGVKEFYHENKGGMRPFCVSSICLRFNVYCKDDKFTKIPFASTGEKVGEGVATAFVPFYGSFPRMLASLISRVEKSL